MSSRHPRPRSDALPVHADAAAASSTTRAPVRSWGASLPARSHHHPRSASFSSALPAVHLAYPPDYSSHGVRKDTAEIASWALSDSPSLPPSATLAAAAAAAAAAAPDSDRRRSSSLRDLFDDPQAHPPVLRRDSLASTLPDAIQEDSELELDHERQLPAPASHPSQSNLADMLQGRLTTYGAAGSTAEQDNLPKPPLEAPNAETTPLLARHRNPSSVRKPSLVQPQPQAPPNHQGPRDVESQHKSRLKPPNKFRQLASSARQHLHHSCAILANPKRWDRSQVWAKGVVQPVSLLPCVFLGVLLNVLDALSYGMILFPLGEPIFAATGPDGISMFYVSCIVAQLVYSCGGSIFKGAVGSEMIEVVPFFHKMTYSIMALTGTSRPEVVLATTITAYALSSIVTGLVFFLLGAFKLGSLVNFFPRHILIGCIGGVGFFLFVTGIEVSARLDGAVDFNVDTLRKLFAADTAPLWTIPLLLSVLLLLIKRYRDHPVVVPAFFLSIAGIFYLVVVATPDLDLAYMRDHGWIFAEVTGSVPFYHFYSYYDFGAVDWSALASTIPAMLALTFFGILHVPINVPALAIAAEEDDVNLNRELVAHGLSNALSGLAGSIQNYLVYVNSEMLIHNGGNSRLAGLLLAAATFGVLVAGPEMIGFVPVMVVGALIFYLGIALLEESLVDTWGKMNRLEYLTVVAIVLVMGVYDFVYGILAGIVFACLNFVIQTSRKSAIRATYNGCIVESTVRRHPVQRRFLHEVGYQTYVTKLAGFLFFGSIVQVEKRSRALIEEEAFRAQPIRFLIFDLTHVSGIDYSAAEAFTRIQRILGRRNVHMLVSGISHDSDVGKSLHSVGLWSDESPVEFFANLNAALEFCENIMLKAFYRQREFLRSGDASPQESSLAQSLEIPRSAKQDDGMLSASYASPRQRFLKQAATSTLQESNAQTSLHPPKKWANYKAPLPLILQTFHELTTQNEDFWHHALPYFVRRHYPPGTLLFSAGDVPEGFYLVESGILRAEYRFDVGNYHELIVAGTTCGELPFFSDTQRTANVRVESQDEGALCWVLTRDEWARMQSEWPEGAREILVVALRLTKERVDAVTSYVLTAAG